MNHVEENKLYDLEGMKIKKEKIIIFGAGDNGEAIFNHLKRHTNIIGFVDNNIKKRNTFFCGLPVWQPDEIFGGGGVKFTKEDIIIVSVVYKEHRENIIRQLRDYDVKNENIFYFGEDVRFLYPPEFYMKMERTENIKCVRNMLSVIMNHLGQIDSAIDLGCGNGLWLTLLNNDFDVKEVLGVDGEWAADVQKNPDNFFEFDLSKPLDLHKRFDLAISIEVAEHLPEQSAKSLVDSLCCHSDVILFSAAIPGQPGENHINCQYPSWWAKLFSHNEYSCVDVLRAKFLYNDNIDYYYKQNMMFYIKSNSQSMRDFINRNRDHLWSPPIDIVHPFI